MLSVTRPVTPSRFAVGRESAPDRRRRLARERQHRRRARLRAERDANALPARKTPRPPADLTLIPWIERLIVPTGPLAGRPFTLGAWQRQFVIGAPWRTGFGKRA